ncbi:MAG: hypothetical protein ACK53Y_13100 [bacterium]|jgi:hypothetical protein
MNDAENIVPPPEALGGNGEEADGTETQQSHVSELECGTWWYVDGGAHHCYCYKCNQKCQEEDDECAFQFLHERCWTLDE